MAGPLTEVTVGLKLPANPLSELLASRPTARIVFAPISGNGSMPPMRYLVSAHGAELEPDVVRDRLEAFFEDVKPIPHGTPGIQCFTGEVKKTLQEPIRESIKTALKDAAHEVLHRPVMMTGDQAYFCIVTTQEGPLEEGVHQMIQSLREQGLQARVMRLGPHRPAHNPGTYDEALTEKQSDFLRTALALGLYDTPRRITLEELASVFGISKAAAHNRMRSAERRVLRRHFDM